MKNTGIKKLSLQIISGNLQTPQLYKIKLPTSFTRNKEIHSPFRFFYMLDEGKMAWKKFRKTLEISFLVSHGEDG